MCALEAAVGNRYSSAASREVHKVGRRSHYTSAVGVGGAAHIEHREVACVLAYYARALHIAYGAAVERNVAAAVDDNAQTVAYDIAHGEDVSFGQREVIGGGERHYARREFARTG